MTNQRPTLQNLLDFLREVDQTFPVALSAKQDLELLSRKLYDNGTLCAAMHGNKIVSLVAGYTKHIINNTAYISIVATLKEGQNKGYASKLLNDFLTIAKEEKLHAVHVYTVSSNIPAVALYKKYQFIEYHPTNEPRPADLHLIRYFHLDGSNTYSHCN